MPTYEFRCRACGQTFTESRPMAESDLPAACPQGHDDTVKLLAVAGAGISLGGGDTRPGPDAGTGGGCCGGGCCG